MNTISFPERVNWTYQPASNQFLFLCGLGTLLRESFPAEKDFLSWFDQVTGIHRLNAEDGAFFQVVGANDPSIFKENLLVLSRGIILQSDPYTIAGSTSFESARNAESIASEDRDKLIAALSQFDHKAAENVTHALKAPVNRIKGIAQILKSEFKESPEQELLVKYLAQTSERLSVIVDHLLRDGDSYSDQVTIEAVVDSALHVAKRINNRPIDTKLEPTDFILTPHQASVLERIIIELLSFNQPLFANERSLEISEIAETGLLLRIHHHFPLGKFELEKGKLIEENALPSGVNEFIRNWDKSTFVTAAEMNAWTYRLYLPIS